MISTAKIKIIPFQSTLPRRERRRIGFVEIKTTGKFQSTLPRRERLNLCCRLVGIVAFQSTLPRRERLQQGGRRVRPSRFNPRSHVGSDTPGQTCTKPIFCFNPRSHVGSDNLWLETSTVMSCFNPRSHVGSDLAKEWDSNVQLQFQSTLPRRERPRNCTTINARNIVSIHAPT